MNPRPISDRIVSSEPPVHSGRYLRTCPRAQRRTPNDPFSVESSVRLIDTQRQLSSAHERMQHLQEEVKLLGDALELQRQCFDGILKEEKTRAQETVEALEQRVRDFADKLTAAHAMVHQLDAERRHFDDERERMSAEHKEAMARVTQAHFETLSAMRRAYEKRLSGETEAA